MTRQNFYTHGLIQLNAFRKCKYVKELMKSQRCKPAESTQCKHVFNYHQLLSGLIAKRLSKATCWRVLVYTNKWHTHGRTKMQKQHETKTLVFKVFKLFFKNILFQSVSNFPRFFTICFLPIFLLKTNKPTKSQLTRPGYKR